MTGPPTTVIDDEVRVTRWEFAGPGAHTGDPVHESDYLVVPVTGGTFAFTDPAGSTRALSENSDTVLQGPPLSGWCHRGTGGTTHAVASTSESPECFVEIELER
jgi:hypothetical protein